MGDQAMSSVRGFAGIALWAFAITLPGTAAQGAVDILGVMADELDRSVEVLSGQDEPLYFLSYEITEQDQAVVAASFGAVQNNSRSESRVLDIDLRVGSEALDNTHPVRDARGFRRSSRTAVPVSDPDALRNVLWLETDRRYKQAAERLARIRTTVQISVDDDSRPADFSAEPPVEHTEATGSIALDTDAWAARLKRYSAPFAESEHILSSRVTLAASATTRWYANSSGARVRTSETAYRLSVSGSTKADDGMELPRYEAFFSFTEDGLPGDAAVLATVRRVISDLEALRVAPVAEPYSGPAILSGRASGVFFHEILGHRVEGHRQRAADDGQTFKDMIGEPLLPESFSVVFDPSVRQTADIQLSGTYRFDNEGVRGQRVEVIEDGVLKRFLMSRKPIEGFSSSNGHGRKQAGFQAVARQSNLFVEVDEPHSDSALKAMLLAQLEEEGKEYGLLFDDIQGGFTMTGRRVPNAFNVLPTMVYRIYADGREELVRGVDLIGTPLTTFSQVAAGGEELAVFNGICGAESGGVPVSAVSPPILVSRIEVQRKEKSQDRLPILPVPPGGALSIPGKLRGDLR